MLDTHFIIYTIKNRPLEVREAFKLHDEQMCMSTITMGELIYEAEKPARPEENLSVIEGMAARFENWVK